MTNIYNYFYNQFNNNTINQSYLIGNIDLESIADDLEKIFSEFFFKKKVTLNYNDIYVIKPENNNISKEKIKDLIFNLKTTSQFNNIKIYIIDECEKLNDYSCNSLLKLLEEPQNNIYAFLITKNMDSIKTTIISRCQKIFISSDFTKNIFDDKIEQIGNNIMKIIEKPSINIIAQNYDLYSLIENKNELQQVLNYLLFKYDILLNDTIKDSYLNNKINTDNNIKKISNIMIILNDNINRLNGNLNKNLSIDRFIIELWRCNNENSWSWI